MQNHRAVANVAFPDQTTRKLADHLHCMLAACNELARCLPHSHSEDMKGLAVRAELTAITHLLQARACAREIAHSNPQLGECAELFVAGTQALEYSIAVPSREVMLGRRLAVSTATQFATLMLRAYLGAYPPAPPPRVAPSLRPQPPRAAAA